MGSHSVCAVVVTFHPDYECLKHLVASLVRQVDSIVVVDNGSASRVLRSVLVPAGEADVELIENGTNLGIAAAQNRGIQLARAKRCSHVVFFDQDSQPSSDLIAKLLGALDELVLQDQACAVVGPSVWDGRLGCSTPFVRFGPWGVTRIACPAGSSDLVCSDFLISSGMMIPLKVLDIVGPMDEALFIDNVDLEWCFRARNMGIPLFGVCGVRMAHALGDQVFRLGRYLVHRHGPIRQYYMMRNRILLYKRVYSPWAWVIQDFFRVLVKIVFFALVFSPRWKNVVMMLRGAWDGMRGVAGKRF